MPRYGGTAFHDVDDLMGEIFSANTVIDLTT